MISKGHWILLPFSLVSNLPNLCLSPHGVVPQRDHLPCTIVDYSFLGVNDDTVWLPPMESMQFGRALHRVLSKILHANPGHGPVFLAKIDIADGFYCIGINPLDIPLLGVLFPSTNTDPLIGFLLALPMGWVNSPPFFCAATETIADLTNASLRSHEIYPFHRLETVAATPAPPTLPRAGTPLTLPRAGAPLTLPDHPADVVPIPTPRLSGSTAAPLAYVDVYMDDFLQLAQGSPKELLNQSCTLLHNLNTVFRPLDLTFDTAARQEPASIKKFKQGDGSWSTTKTMLGWSLDTMAITF